MVIKSSTIPAAMVSTLPLSDGAARMRSRLCATRFVLQPSLATLAWHFNGYSPPKTLITEQAIRVFRQDSERRDHGR